MVAPRTVDEVPELVVMPYDPDLSARRYVACMARAVLDEVIAPIDAVESIAAFVGCSRAQAAARLDELVSAFYAADVAAAQRPAPLRRLVDLTARAERLQRAGHRELRPWSRWLAAIAR